MSDQPQIHENADAGAKSFLHVFRDKIGQHLSPVDTKLALTSSGAQSQFWRSVGSIWQKLVTFTVAGTVIVSLAPQSALAAQTPIAGKKTRACGMSIMILTKWLRSSASFAMPSKFSSAQVKQSHKPRWAIRSHGKSRRSGMWSS
jgi:hypothetical protein